jgi:hypothetical protein
MNNTLKAVIFSSIIFSFSSLLNITMAKDYKVEVIIFENNNASIASENNDYEPPKRMKSGSRVWFLEPSLLVDQADKIVKSSDYELKYHYAYGVESLPYQDSANYTIVETDTKGYIKVYADQLLFANIDIDHNGFRMNQKRRLKLNERHFFDHPKFGLLLQVSRLEAKPKEVVKESSIENNNDSTDTPLEKLEGSR